MAFAGSKRGISQAEAFVCSLAAFWCLHAATGTDGIVPESNVLGFDQSRVWACVGAGMSGWGGCMDAQDVFGSVRENSRYGDIVAELMVDTTAEGLWWSLDGKDADWFFLEDGSIRLNTTAEKVLDREVNTTLKPRL